MGDGNGRKSWARQGGRRRGWGRRAVARLLAATVVAGGLVVVGMATPALAANVFTDSPTYGPNAVITVTGQTDFVTNCPAGGVNDVLGESTARIYIIPESVAVGIQDGSTLTDVQPRPHVVVDDPTAGFLNEPIGFTAPAGHVGPGTYALVVDECQDGIYHASIDDIFLNAFTVAFPSGTGTLPSISLAIAAIKADANAQATRWATVAGDLKILFWIESKAPQDSVDKAISMIEQKVGQATGVDPRKDSQVLALNEAQSYASLAADPPDPNFTSVAPLQTSAPLLPSQNDPVDLAATALGNQANVDNGTAQAALNAMQRYEGAQGADDLQSGLDQAMALQGFASDLTSQLPKTDSALSALSSAIGALPASFDTESAALAQVQQQLTANGLNADETAELSALGIPPATVSTDVADIESEPAGATRAQMQASIAALVASNTQAAADYQALATNSSTGLPPTITALQTEEANADAAAASAQAGSTQPSEPLPVAEPAPTAAPGGPYTGTVGTPIALNGSASTAAGGATIASYAWDADGSGTFASATGATPSITLARPFDGFVGLRVTDSRGRSSLAYTRLTVTTAASPPAITAFSPTTDARVVPSGSQSFSVTAGPPGVTFAWSVDGTVVPAAITSSFLYQSPATAGLHFVAVVVSGPDPSGGVDTELWAVQVLPAPGPLDHLDLAPSVATGSTGVAQAYTAEGWAATAGGDLGDVTAASTFTIGPDGSCTAASCTPASPGAHTVTGRDGSATGTATLNVPVPVVATTTGLMASPASPAASGQAVQLTATVTPASGTATPTGTVDFLDGTAPLGSATLSGGTASITTSSLGVGGHSLTASYEGNPGAGFAASASVPLAYQIDVAPQVTASPTSLTVVAGQNATFNAAASGTPMPSVQWQMSSGGGPFTNVANATATQLVVTDPLVSQSGTSYRAVFQNPVGSATTGAATLTVTKAATSTAVVAVPSPVAAGSPFTVTATVAATAPGTGTPTGSVSIADGHGQTCPITLAPASGGSTASTGSCNLTETTPGSYHVVGTYGGDGNFAGSVSTPATEIVASNAPPPTGLDVYAGYADTLRPNPASFPTPWLGSPNVTFNGCTGGCTFDAGAIRVVNNSPNPVTIDSVVVKFGNASGVTDANACVDDVWPHSQSLAPGAEAIYTQEGATGSGCPAASFDSSDIGPDGAGWAANCSESGVIPEVDVSVGGTVEKLADSGQIINTGGFDSAACSAIGTFLGGFVLNESEPWTLLGTSVCPGASLGLAPPSQSVPLGPATLAATFTNGCGQPLSDTSVNFAVTAGPNKGATGTATTSAGGVASFSYTGAVVGTDTVQATVSNPAGSISSNTATVTWTPAPATTLTYTGPTSGDHSDTVNLSATLTGGTAQLPVFTGYADIRDPNFPSPWVGASGVVCVCDPSLAAAGDPDESAVRIDNPTGSAVTITDVKVTCAGANQVFDLWGSPTIPAKETLVLTGTVGHSFDGSDGCTAPDTVAVTVGGTTTTLADPSHGIPGGPSSADETIPWTSIGSVGGTSGGSGSAPIAGQVLTLTLGGHSCTTAATNSTGVASCPVTITDDVGTLAAGGSFAGAGALPAATAPPVPFTVTPEETVATYTGATSGDSQDSVTLSGTLTDGEQPPVPIAGKSLLLTVGTQSCTATTGVTGAASCPVTLSQPAGSVTASAAFAGDPDDQAASSTGVAFTINHEEAAVTYTGATLAAGAAFRLSAVLTTDGNALAGRLLTFQVGSGGSSQSCSATTGGTGSGSCTIAALTQPEGSATSCGTGAEDLSASTFCGTLPVTVSFAGDSYYVAASQQLTVVLATIACSTSITGNVPGAVNVTKGTTCFDGATVGGAVLVQPGAALVVIDSTLKGSVVTTGAKAVTVCNSTVVGSITVQGSTGLVLIGGGSDASVACAGNQLGGAVVLGGSGSSANTGAIELSGNTIRVGSGAAVELLGNRAPNGGLPVENNATEMEANTIGGAVVCQGNVPAPTNDGQPNSITGSNTGQCQGL